MLPGVQHGVGNAHLPEGAYDRGEFDELGPGPNDMKDDGSYLLNP